MTLQVLIFGLCSHFHLNLNFKQPLNALEIGMLQKKALQCNTQYKCLSYATIKRHEIGGPSINVVCKRKIK